MQKKPHIYSSVCLVKIVLFKNTWSVVIGQLTHVWACSSHLVSSWLCHVSAFNELHTDKEDGAFQALQEQLLLFFFFLKKEGKKHNRSPWSWFTTKYVYLDMWSKTFIRGSSTESQELLTTTDMVTVEEFVRMSLLRKKQKAEAVCQNGWQKMISKKDWNCWSSHHSG